MTLRRAKEDEHEEIAELHRLCFKFGEPLPADDEFCVIEQDNEIIAYAAWRPSQIYAHTAFLSIAGVHPEHRGRGFQRKLILYRCRWAKRLGYRYAHTYTIGNPASGNSLIGCGFRLFSPQLQYAGVGALYWQKKLFIEGA